MKQGLPSAENLGMAIAATESAWEGPVSLVGTRAETLS
jgi:hypothetical protein